MYAILSWEYYFDNLVFTLIIRQLSIFKIYLQVHYWNDTISIP